MAVSKRKSKKSRCKDIVKKSLCKRQPKASSNFTPMGQSFSAQMTGRHTGTNGALDSRFSVCNVRKHLRLEGNYYQYVKYTK